MRFDGHFMDNSSQTLVMQSIENTPVDDIFINGSLSCKEAFVPTRRCLFVLMIVLLATLSSAEQKPIIVVNAFTTASDVAWPYDMKQMQIQTIAELRAKLGTRYEIVETAPA